jgi:hypothetical protein
VKLPTPATPKLGDVVVSSTDLTKERRLYGFAKAATTPELKLQVPTEGLEPRAPRLTREVPRLALVPRNDEKPISTDEATRLTPVPRNDERPISPDDDAWPFVVDEPAPTTALLPEPSSKPERIPAWRARGRTHARPGSKWVVKPARLARSERRMRRGRSQSSSEVGVPRDGVEPPTRGFSVRCSTS